MRQSPASLICTALLGFTSLPGYAASPTCPTLDGHYRVENFGETLGNALEALGASSAGFTDSEVRLAGPRDGTIQLWIKSGLSGRFPASPSAVLAIGKDFSCKDGWVHITRTAHATRKTDSAYYEGRSALALQATTGGGLTLAITFTGRQTTTLYAYDSARLSIPKPFTSVSLHESIRWPSNDEPRTTQRKPVPEQESDSVRSVRSRVSREILGSVMLNTLREREGAVLATLTATRSDDLAGFEDRLRAANIRYAIQQQPVWSNNGYYLTMLIYRDPAPAGTPQPPSTMRIQQELAKMHHPLVDARSVEADGAGFVATLTLLGDVTLDHALARLRANSNYFGQIDVLEEAPDPMNPRVRLARLRLTLR